MRRSLRCMAGVAMTVSAVTSALVVAQSGPPAPPAASRRFTMRVVSSGLADPWELSWGPDGQLWVTERTALRITRIDPDSGERRVVANLEGLATAAGPGGVLGMAFRPAPPHDDGPGDVYVAVTYEDRSRPPDPGVDDPASIFRHLYAKVVRLRFDLSNETLGDPVTVLDGLPAGSDHLGLRLAFALDGMLHMTIGDQGSNQFSNACRPVLSQRLPTQAEVDRHDWSAYEGKTLRMTAEGTIPPDNPVLNDVRSHVYTYGHRNPQGLAVGPEGTLYATDHGPKSDDEVNVLAAGGNYGWPHVAGFRDDRAYQYARWADATTSCRSLRYSDHEVPDAVPRETETAFSLPMMAPIATLFTVPSGHDFEDPACGRLLSVCWPTVAPASIESYAGNTNGIPGWDRVLIVSSLKRGSLYVVPIDTSGRRLGGAIAREAQTGNRYRDTTIHPNGGTIFVATDADGLVESSDGRPSSQLENRGAILAFSYVREPGEP